MICILEDDPNRVAEFRAAAQTAAPGMAVRFWNDAHTMIADLPALLEQVRLISLDHDLTPANPGSPDPGTGYDIATLLAELIPFCPVIVHTSNGDRANWMIGELSRAGWRYRRVYPDYGNWIATRWARSVEEMLGDPARDRTP